MMLDPFHDTTLNVVGLPDEYSGRSIVYDLRRQIQISRPSSIASTANWDAHVAIKPTMTTWDNGSKAYNCGSAKLEYNNNKHNILTLDADAAGTAAQFPAYVPQNSPVVVNMTESGNGTFMPAISDSADRWAGIDILSGMDLAPTTKFRVIGLAFEVHNTTAAIDRQGLVTCYRTGQDKQDYLLNIRKDTGPVIFGPLPVAVRQGPPTSVAYAQQLDGVSWKAEEGCLVVSPISFEHNPPSSFNAEFTVDSATVAANGDLLVYAPAGAYTTTSPNIYACASAEIPTSLSGAYFTGLSPETTLSLVVRAFIEVFPRFDDPNFALARPSPAYDPEVATVVTAIQRAMLPGYPVGMNAKGDFFAAVVDKLKGAYRIGKAGLGIAADLTGDPRLKAARAGISATESLAKEVKQMGKEVKAIAKQKKK